MSLKLVEAKDIQKMNEQLYMLLKPSPYQEVLLTTDPANFNSTVSELLRMIHLSACAYGALVEGGAITTEVQAKLLAMMQNRLNDVLQLTDGRLDELTGGNQQKVQEEMDGMMAPKSKSYTH